MNRWEYMRQLEELLSDISPAEKEEALHYYNDYFNDAGPENEQQVIEELGTPQQVAANVKEGLGLQPQGQSRSLESANEKVYQGEQSQAENKTQGMNQTQNMGTGNGAQSVGTQKAKEGLPVWAIVLIVIGCIILSPFILAGLSVVISILIAIFSTILGLIVGLAAATLALLVAAIVLLVAAFSILPVSILAGCALIGVACILAAIGILFLILVVLLTGKVIPAICKGIAYLWRKIFNKGGVNA